MPNDVGCPICGKRYFPHSLKIHLPQCQRKWASVEVPCPRCDKPILQGELEEHLEKCRAPRRAALHRRSWNGDTANAARALSLPISRARPARKSWSGPAQHDSPRQAAAAAFRTQFKPKAPRPASRTKRWEPPADTTAFSTAAAAAVENAVVSAGGSHRFVRDAGRGAFGLNCVRKAAAAAWRGESCCAGPDQDFLAGRAREMGSDSARAAFAVSPFHDRRWSAALRGALHFSRCSSSSPCKIGLSQRGQGTSTDAHLRWHWGKWILRLWGK